MAALDHKQVKVLVVGQTPPPYGGQAVSIQLMLEGKYQALKLFLKGLKFWRKQAADEEIAANIRKGRMSN